MIMGALTVSIVMADLWFLHSDRIVTHTILGGIAITISGISSVSVNWLAIIEATEVG